MKFIGLILVLAFLFDGTSSRIPELTQDAYLLTPHLIQKYNYISETHSVYTEDGYILEVHRIIGKPSKIPQKKKKPVLIMHGLETSSSDWVLMGPDKGLGYYLSDHGYDVWLGNSRGNRYSRQNIYMSPNDREFWRFSWHQIGIYDLPAMIDYIVEKSGFPKISYVGFSQGSTSYFVMASERPEYLNKLTHVQALSPVAFIKHTKSPLFGFSTVFSAYLESRDSSLVPFELLQNNPNTRLLAQFLCNQFINENLNLCRKIMFMVGGFNTNQINATMLPVIYGHIPAGSSTMQFGHYGQLVKSGKFRQYDYGTQMNRKKYGTDVPPDYNLTRATLPIALHYGDNDDISQPVDVKILYRRLPNVIGLYRVAYKNWAHMDFVYGVDARELVYDRVIEILNKYS